MLGRANPLLRGACLAAALLVPAVAALHAIVLASVHVDGKISYCNRHSSNLGKGAVDMDIYGAFQICAIGVLAGPVTVKLSATYFNTPGRNLIFVWTTMVLAGLLSLTVEFFRANPTPCTKGDFQYDPEGGSFCDLRCDTATGPFSPIRKGAQNNIYVIPSPTRFSFSAAILVCAACCIPAVLSLVSMWNKILKLNWKKRFGGDADSEIEDRQISGTNAATPRRMTAVNLNIKFYLSMVEIPIFGCAIVAILVIGEYNLWDQPVFFQQEPIESVGMLCGLIAKDNKLIASGQWAPIVGTILAVVGSLYTYLAAGGFKDDGSRSEENQQHCSHNCRCHENPSDTASSTAEMQQVRSPDDMDVFEEGSMLSPNETHRSTKAFPPPTTPISSYSPTNLKPTDTNASVAARSLRLEKSGSSGANGKDDDGNTNSRHKVARLFETIGTKIGTPAPSAFDDAQFRKGLASNYPLVPGEKERSENWREQQLAWNSEGLMEDSGTPLRRTKSRSGSFRSERSGNAVDDNTSGPNTPVVEEAAGPSTSTASARRATLQVPKKERPHLLGTPRRSTVSTSAAPPPPSPTIQISEHEDAEKEATPEVQTPVTDSPRVT